MASKTPTWATTFNGNLKTATYMQDAFERALYNGYEFVAWNGWVYATANTKGGPGERLMLAEDLK
jgi:hypothetical protein